MGFSPCDAFTPSDASDYGHRPKDRTAIGVHWN